MSELTPQAEKIWEQIITEPNRQKPNFVAIIEAGLRAAVEQFRMDELEAVMLSVDKWFPDDDPRLTNNPATRACDAREIALRAIEAAEVQRDTALSTQKEQAWACKAKAPTDPPQDCDWPCCGCDPYADKVLTALDEANAHKVEACHGCLKLESQLTAALSASRRLQAQIAALADEMTTNAMRLAVMSNESTNNSMASAAASSSTASYSYADKLRTLLHGAERNEIQNQEPARAASPEHLEELREQLAALCHEQWTGWMNHLFQKGDFQVGGSLLLGHLWIERWARQMQSPYAQLSDSEKDSDRKEADRILEIIHKR